MKQYIKLLAYLLFLMFPHKAFSEGFIAGTFVNTPRGHECIENLSVGDDVVCFDNDKNIITRPIVGIVKKHVLNYAFVHTVGECIGATSDQKFYNKHTDSWVAAVDLKNK